MNVNTQIAAGNKKTKRAFVFRCVFISRSCDGSRAVLNLARLSGMEGSTPDSLIEFTFRGVFQGVLIAFMGSTPGGLFVKGVAELGECHPA